MVLSKELKFSLIEAACSARLQSYSPYSKFAVGAALLTKSGSIILGTNVENASFSMTICAERTAIVQAIAQGHKEFIAIAIVTKEGDFPCGACRQVLSEFNSSAMPILIGNENKKLIHETTLGALLPEAFVPQRVLQIHNE